MKRHISSSLKIFKNKYVLALIIFGVWMTIFDQNNFLFRIKNLKKLKQLEMDKKYYLEKIQKDSTQIKELTSSKNYLEKFARETYYMKKDNEDIYIIMEKE